MENQTPKNDGIISWLGDSVIFKLGIIGFLTLLLLIPSAWIQSLIVERQNRQQEVIKEIADKWSGSQLVQGPVMVLPYKTMIQQKDNAGKLIYEEVLTNIYILPEVLNITSTANPKELKRGIFDAVVYDAKIKVRGKFSMLELKKSGINPDKILWNKVKVDIGLSDLKGLKNNPIITLADQKHSVEPDFTDLKLFSNNLVIIPDLSTDRNTALTFSFDLDLRGSTALNFLHLGKSTVVKVEGNWSNPSFTGRYLPENRTITDTTFAAVWNLPFFNRSYPQQWIAENTTFNTDIQDAKDTIEPVVSSGNNTTDPYFGVNFILPIDQYQKTMRSTKYSVLVILLTFISLFFTELLQKKKVHLLQYILIGVAMIIYYTLLLAFSERVGFNWAYLIASVSTVTLISVFIATLLNNKTPALIFGSILSTFYCFIFVIIQLQDLALIFGSIGLFITVAILMYLSTKIDWNKRAVHE
jgi:inner membrane protein